MPINIDGTAAIRRSRSSDVDHLRNRQTAANAKAIACQIRNAPTLFVPLVKPKSVAGVMYTRAPELA